MVFALLKRLRTAQHQEPASALGNEPLQQHHLVSSEKRRLEIIDDHRVETVKILGRRREPSSQLLRITRVQAHENRLVISFHVLRSLVVETTEQRIARLASAADEVKSRLPFRDPDECRKL